MANFNPYGNFFNPYQQYQPMQQIQQPIQQPVQQVQTPIQQVQTIPQIQNGGIVSVHSRKEAFDYPIAPGNGMTFFDESAMKCYIKSKGYAPFEQPSFAEYDLVKVQPEAQSAKQAQNEPINEPTKEPIKNTNYATKDELAAVLSEIDALKANIESLTVKKPVKKKESEE